MNSREVALQAIAALNANTIPYMLVGSFSTNFYGMERSTKDADIVVELGGRSIGDVFRSLGRDFRCDPQMLLETVTATLRYVITHTASSFKIELFMLSNDPHDQERFRRRIEVEYLGTRVWIPTAEDVVVTKSRWAARAHRPKDEQDVAAVLGVQRGRLDLAYIRQWCDTHGSRSTFESIFEAVESKFA